jgi:hypothetical protein
VRDPHLRGARREEPRVDPPREHGLRAERRDRDERRPLRVLPRVRRPHADVHQATEYLANEPLLFVAPALRQHLVCPVGDRSPEAPDPLPRVPREQVALAALPQRLEHEREKRQAAALRVHAGRISRGRAVFILLLCVPGSRVLLGWRALAPSFAAVEALRDAAEVIADLPGVRAVARAEDDQAERPGIRREHPPEDSGVDDVRAGAGASVPEEAAGVRVRRRAPSVAEDVEHVDWGLALEALLEALQGYVREDAPAFFEREMACARGVADRVEVVCCRHAPAGRGPGEEDAAFFGRGIWRAGAVFWPGSS